MNVAKPQLIEGIDYYVENGQWVFTAEFHRKRGHCCGSGCRHCPFGNSPADRTKTMNDEVSRTEPPTR